MLPILAALIPSIVNVVGDAVRGHSKAIDMGLDIVSKTLGQPVNALSEVKDISAEQALSLQQAENEFKQSFNTAVISLVDAEVRDRDSARKMQIALNSRMPAILSFTLTVEVFIMYMVIVFADIDADAVKILEGGLMYMLSVFGMAVGYWFGSTHGSRVKDFLK
jgi:hypothetical protein